MTCLYVKDLHFSICDYIYIYMYGYSPALGTGYLRLGAQHSKDDSCSALSADVCIYTYIYNPFKGTLIVMIPYSILCFMAPRFTALLFCSVLNGCRKVDVP